MEEQGQSVQSPKLARWLLEQIVSVQHYGSIIGDFEETFKQLVRDFGYYRASAWYWGQIFRSLPAFIHQSIYWGVHMFRNYMTVAIRNFRKYRGYAAINILGFSIGIACCLLILLFVRDELSYDRYHENAERIYRVGYNIKSSSGERQQAWVSALAGPLLPAEHPEVLYSARLKQVGAFVKNGERAFMEKSFFYADADIFKVFTFPMLAGNPETALTEPYSLVLTKSTAEKYFPGENPLGKQLIVEDTLHYNITGIVADVPANSHFRFDMLASHITREKLHSFINHWFALGTHTYLLLREETDATALEENISGMVMRHYGEELEGSGFELSLFMQPLTEIHLHSHLERELEANSDISYVYIFSVIAAIIMLIACINFMNLSTARASQRAREVGIRKVIGSRRRQLVMQFLGESLFQTLLAFLMGGVLTWLLLPYFNLLTGKLLTVAMLLELDLFLWLFGLLVLIGLLSGIYPALVLSAFRPADILRGGTNTVGKRGRLRKGLVIFQFTISVALIAGTLIVSDQLTFMMNQSLGFTTEQMFVIDLSMNDAARDQAEDVKQALLQYHHIKHATVTHTIPGRGLLERVIRQEGADENEQRTIGSVLVDADFIPAYELQIAAGRAFLSEISTDVENAFILNETAVASFGWTNESALGKKIEWGRKHGEVIGVVKDFHFQSLQERIPPILMTMVPGANSFISLRVDTENLAQTLSHIQSVWTSRFPDRPFNYFFLNEDFEKQYLAESRLSRLFSSFSMLAMITACLGLFGLAAFTIQQRAKEIAVRKVYGANFREIFGMLTGDFLRLIFTAFIFAIPLSLLAMNRWLTDFPYRTKISPEIYLVSGLLLLGIVLITISFQAGKAAIANPIKALRHE